MTSHRRPTRIRTDLGFSLKLRGGIWQFVRTVDGLRRPISTGFREDQLDAAQRKATEINDDINNARQGWKKTVIPTVRAWMTVYRASHLPTLSARTQETYPAYLDILVHEFGSKRLSECKPSECKTLINALCSKRTGRPYAHNTRRAVQFIYQGVWTQAQRDYPTLVNPWTDLPWLDVNPRERVLTHDELQKVWPYLTSAPHRRLTTVFLLTGQRVEEATSLTADHLDFRRHEINIPASIAKYGIPRTLPMTDEVEAAYREQMAALASGEIVFTRREQRERAATGILFPWVRHTLSDYYGAVADAAGVAPFTTHDLRRTYGTVMAPKTVAKRLMVLMGHKRIDTTMKFYVQLDKRHDRESVDQGAGAFLAAAITPPKKAGRVLTMRAQQGTKKGTGLKNARVS